MNLEYGIYSVSRGGINSVLQRQNFAKIFNSATVFINQNHFLLSIIHYPLSISHYPFMSTETNFEGIKVVVIDDSKTIRRTAEMLLKKAGCEVITATDGFESLSKVMEHQPNIIFVDIMMPRLDGYQTCALIKNNQAFKKIPVVMLSSKDGLFERARSRIVGAEHYMTKPFTREELLNTIKTYVVDAKTSTG
jgi:twitching motility two-component system response regulator PilG